MLETNTCQITTPKVLFWSIHKKKTQKHGIYRGKSWATLAVSISVGLSLPIKSHSNIKQKA